MKTTYCIQVVRDTLLRIEFLLMKVYLLKKLWCGVDGEFRIERVDSGPISTVRRIPKQPYSLY